MLLDALNISNILNSYTCKRQKNIYKKIMLNTLRLSLFPSLPILLNSSDDFRLDNYD